jgi:Fe(3+) dicitrate transport protein
VISLLFASPLLAQQEPPSDSLDVDFLPDITVIGRNTQKDVSPIPKIVGTTVYAGKKNALIIVDNVKGNLVTNTVRQVLSKVPGLYIWESDGSGIQIGISARGLSPNRSWEFNVRQNGYDISADPYGYPEAYYNPPLQAVQRIELIRGHGALQYGPQFGGMVNYVLRNGSNIHKPIESEVRQSVGSNSLLHTFLGMGGQKNKLQYYTFFDHRQGDGWRDHNRYGTQAGYGTLTYRVNEKLTLSTEVMYSHIRSQQPGGLTDAQFRSNPRQSLRQRNWMDITWLTAAWLLNYDFSPTGRMNLKIFHVKGDRNSIGFLKPVTLPDLTDDVTGAYAPRTVDIDQYRNWGFEGRILQEFEWWGRKQTATAGLRAYRGNTFRYREGAGTNGVEYSKKITEGRWPRDIDFTSQNLAFFTEQMIRLGRNWVIVPGIRYEFLTGAASGINGYGPGGSPLLLQQQEKTRAFVLGGLGMEWPFNGGAEAYANITQAYRPIQFGDLTLPPGSDLIDPELKDASGYNADIGYRGKVKDWLTFDLSLYYLRYHDRIGNLTRQNAAGAFYNYRTNVGNSSSKGTELLVEVRPLRLFRSTGKKFDLHYFSSYALTDAIYGDYQVTKRGSSGELESFNLKGQKVEYAPRHILRTGLTIYYSGISLTAQYSQVSGVFSDANNTVEPTANGQIGWIPGYRVWDLTLNGNIGRQFIFKAGVNNLLNRHYFTRRSSGYPGPGLLPADGRAYFLTFGVKI